MFIKHAIFENTVLRKSVHELAPGQIEIIFILQKPRLLHGSFTFMPNNLPVSTSFIFEISRASGKTRGNRRLRPYEPKDPLDHPLPSPSWFRPHPSTDLRHLATRSPHLPAFSLSTQLSRQDVTTGSIPFHFRWMSKEILGYSLHYQKFIRNSLLLLAAGLGLSKVEQAQISLSTEVKYWHTLQDREHKFWVRNCLLVLAEKESGFGASGLCDLNHNCSSKSSRWEEQNRGKKRRSNVHFDPYGKFCRKRRCGHLLLCWLGLTV